MLNEKLYFRPVIVMAPGVIAGAEKVVLTGLHGLQEAGANPVMIIIKETRAPELAEKFKNLIDPSIETHFIESKKAFDLQLPLNLKKVLVHIKGAVVLHSHGFKALIACYMAKANLKHIHTHHGNTGHTFKVKIYEKLAMLTMKKCDVIVAVSEKMKKDLKKSLSPFENIVVIDNMLSLKNADQIRAKRIERYSNQVNILRKELIYIGRISPEKGLCDFLTYFSSYDKRSLYHLTVIGDGPDKFKAQKIVEAKELATLVSFLGFITDPSKYLTKADLLILPSHREGLPMTLIEALCCGVPVIASDVGAISLLIKDKGNGKIVLIHDPNQWQAALDEGLEHSEQWNDFALKDAPNLQRQYSANEWSRKTIDLYKKTLR